MSLGLASDAVDSASVVPHTSESQDEREGLLEKMVARVIKNPRTLAIFYGVCNLSNFLIGAGILGLTSVFASGGWLSGFILFAIFGFATWFSLDLLLESGCSTNCFSYEGLGFTVGGWTLQLVSCPNSTTLFSSNFRVAVRQNNHHHRLVRIPRCILERCW